MGNTASRSVDSWLPLVLFLASFLILAACSGESRPVPGRVNAVTILEAPSALAVGDSTTLTVSVSATGNVNRGVEWRTGNAEILTVSDGVVTAVGVGTTTITASSVASPTIQDVVTIIVLARPTVSGPIAAGEAQASCGGNPCSIERTMEPTRVTLSVGGVTFGFAPQNASGAGSTVGADGALVIPPGGRLAMDLAGLSLTTPVNVWLIEGVNTVALLQSTLPNTDGSATLDFSPTLAGLSVQSNGETSILTTATNSDGDAIDLQVGITLSETDDEPAIQSVVIVGDSTRSVAVGASTPLTANVTSVGGAPTTVTWSSSAPGVATVDVSGLVRGVSIGSATITAVSTFDATKSASVTINVPGVMFELMVTKVGSGSGSVTSEPEGIDCGSDCSAEFASGTSVTLTAVPDAGSSFIRWTGGCTVTTVTCILEMTQARNVTATFALTSQTTLMVAAGHEHSLALLSDGTVRAWGRNGSGQLGDGSFTDSSSTPVIVSGLSGVTAIAAGYGHSLAFLSDGTVRAWGSNGYGQLGDGIGTDRRSPVFVSGLSNVTAIAAGGKHSLALLSDGTLRAWGSNWDGQLADGGPSTDRRTPVIVSGVSGVTAIAAGWSHSLAVLQDGTVRAWGGNWDGQLGDGTTTDRRTPVRVSGLSGVTAIAAGTHYSLALLSDGTVRAWGGNGSGELGDGTDTGSSTPVRVSGLSGVTAIAAGAYHSLAVLEDGTVRAWGLNGSGQLGDGATINRGTPVIVSGLSGVTAIAAGWRHSLAVLQDTTARGWGSSFNGQVGDETPTYSTLPVEVVGIPD